MAHPASQPLVQVVVHWRFGLPRCVWLHIAAAYAVYAPPDDDNSIQSPTETFTCPPMGVSHPMLKLASLVMTLVCSPLHPHLQALN